MYSFKTDVLKEYDYLTILWDREINTIIMKWRGFAQGEKFRKGIAEGVDWLTQKKCTTMLADLREAGVLTQEDQRWYDEDFLPVAAAKGLRHVASIIPTSAITRLAVRRMSRTMKDSEIIMHLFDDLMEARDWLQSS